MGLDTSSANFYLPHGDGSKLVLSIAAASDKAVTATKINADGTTERSDDLTIAQASKLKSQYDAFHQLAMAAKRP
jgi:hypothetical protein